MPRHISQRGIEMLSHVQLKKKIYPYETCRALKNHCVFTTKRREVLRRWYFIMFPALQICLAKRYTALTFQEINTKFHAIIS